jgi:hypothetical protein
MNRPDLAARAPRVAHVVRGTPFTGDLVVHPTAQRSA